MLPLVRLPPLDLIKGFVAVARRMSVTQAADDLCLTQSAISKQIRALEDWLGVPLFNRGFRALTLTENGEALFRAADASMSQLQDALALLGPPRRRAVSITASTGVSALWLLPRLGEFHKAHPDVALRIHTSNAVVELGRDMDLAVRYSTERNAPLGAIKLFCESLAMVCSPSLGISSIRSKDVLSRLTLLDFDVQGRSWLRWESWLAERGWKVGDARGVFVFNQYEQLIQAAISGQGVAIGRLELLAQPLAENRLRILEGSTRQSDGCCWLIQAEKDPPEDVRLAVQWILSLAHEIPAPRTRAHETAS